MNRSGRWRYLRLAQLVWKLPTYTRVVWGMLRDRRTPLYLKLLLGAALVYVATPLDLIPDAVPLLGQADDLTVVLLVLDLFMANAPDEVRADAWRRARSGVAQLDEDLARLRHLLGPRYDQIRDLLPHLLERYGDLREPGVLRDQIARWRIARMEADGADARHEEAPVAARDAALN